MGESVEDKCMKLSNLFTDNGRTDGSSWRLCREALLDAFLVLFNECDTEHMQKDKYVAGFVKKYQDNVKSVQNTRPSISDFKVITIIGRGHFGQVQVVKEINTNNVYALKTLKKSEMLSQENVAFFEEERDIMAYGRSPWITSLHYAFQDTDNLYLVMEFHPGGDLLTLLGKQENETLEESVAKFYLAEIVLALHSLHELGYVHRDVKPDNILIDKHGHIKLADFGSAAKLSLTDKKVYSKMAVGTPEYISPEVLTSMEGSGGGYGVECDWWSLGVVAYEMLYGNPPFTGSSVAVTYSKIMSHKESLVFPTDIKVSRSLKSLIKGLLTDIKTRFNYDDLIQHEFFKGVKWSTLEKEQPPYVPTISGVDDTSNFDEFDPEEDPQFFGNARSLAKKAFNGKDLPFVGFTFTKSNNNSPEQEQTAQGGVLSENLRTTSNGTIDEGESIWEGERVELKKMVENLENEKDLLEKEKILKESEIKDLKKRLDLERTDRNKADSTALKLMSEVEIMRNNAHNLRKEETRAVFDEQQDVLTQLEEDRFVAMKRTRRLEEELAAQRKTVEEKDIVLAELLQKNTELKEQLKLAKTNDGDVVEILTQLRQVQEEVSQYSPVPKIRQLRAVRRQSSPLTGSMESGQRVEEISNRILEAILKCQDKEKSDLKRMRERLKQKMDECSELESQLDKCKSLKRKLQKAEENVSEAEKQNKRLSDAIKKMEKEVEEASDVSEECRRTAALQEKKLKESEAVVFKLKEDLRHTKEETDSIVESKRELEEEFIKMKESCRNLKNTQKILNEQLEKQTKHIEKLEWTAKYTSSKQSIDGENERHFKSQLELKNTALKEAETQNKELKERINSLIKKDEELEEELQQKESLIENLLKNELAIKTAMEDEQTNLKTEIIANSKDLEAAITALSNKNSEIESENKELCDQVEKLMEKCECLIKAKQELENEVKEKIQVIEDLKMSNKPSKEDMLKESIRNDSEEIQDLKAEIVVINNENKELKGKIKELQSDMRQQMNELTELRTKSETFNAELNTKVKKVEDHEKTITMLKTTCTMLEGQIEELEILNDELDEKNVQLEIEKKQLLLTNEKYEARLEEQLSEEKEGALSKDQLDQHKALIREYSETIADQGNQLKVSELNLKSLERKMDKEMAAKQKLTNEMKQQKDTLVSLEEAYTQLIKELEEIKERHEEVLSENGSMAEHLETLKSLHAEEKVKLVSTSAQQSKLIDFLQSKAETKSSKRKVRKKGKR